ncbi:MAG: D-alanine-D-alanine ligase [Mycobacterium sp.]|jgi:D-alanine-D-alanine ligase|nr:D-alanine-D-alanine ligase [Mycobacterium sp.]
MNKPRVRVGIVYGGRSTEHAISCASAGAIMRNLDPRRFDVVGIGITPEGTWVRAEADPDRLEIRPGRLPRVDASWGAAVTSEEALASVDVAFPYTEDAKIQGLLDLAGVPYVGGEVFAIAAGVDKEFIKKLMAADGVPVCDYVVLRPRQETVAPGQLERLGLPVFVKPARSGSSLGVSRVTDADQLPDAIAAARRYDRKVLVEAAVRGRELACGLLEYPDGTVEASTVGEIRVEGRAEGRFFDFAAKYVSHADRDVPAKIDDDVAAEVRQLAIRAFHAIECRGFARVEFFLTEDGPMVNEINPIPAMMPDTMYPKLWDASGVDYPTLLATMVDTALALAGSAPLESLR